jgi:serine/threonine-protein kinase
MGEVYRARDTNLKRDVAIKALLPDVATDPDRLARFIREARILASLNHPNIALIHGIEDSNGLRVFVMELIDGPTLSERIAQGAVPVGDALAIARQIAEALEAAHDKGVIHRDLKPANIKVRPDGTVKVLDFGIAKIVDPPAASTAAALRADSPTGTGPVVTQSGIVFGTAAYMSPEQARGLMLDKRTDIWAFGCVLYEMLTARPPFSGQTLSDVRDAILNREPDWTRLPEATPVPVARLLRRCLEKDRRRRLADAADARLEIDDALTRPLDAKGIAAANASRGRLLATPILLALAAGGFLAAAGTWAMLRAGSLAPAPISRFTIVPPPAQSLDVQDNDRNLALSPDGRHLVYRSGGSSSGGPLMLRALDRLDAQPLAGVTNARGPFFSFDGRSVAFFDRSAIRRMPLTGEPATTICTFAEFFPRGGSWGDDGTIVFATSDETTGLWRVSAAGGTPAPLTTPDPAHQEKDHLFPSMLPGGRGVLFTIEGLGQHAPLQVAVLDLRDGHRHTLIPGGSQAEYIAPPPGSGDYGYLTYAAAGALRAVRFDLSRLQIIGESTALVDHLQMAVTGAANYAVARNGTLVYLPGEQAPARSLVWVNREGREEHINAPPLTYAVPRLSPDGKRLVVEMRAQDHDLWLWDFAQQKLSPLTFGPWMDQSPVWTLNGRQIVFASNRAGAFNVYVQNADGTGPAQRLSVGPSSEYPTTITADGLRVICNQLVNSQVGIVRLALASRAPGEPSRPESLINTPFEEVGAQISPNGRYLAYQSNESGRFQVYVRPFPNVSAGHWQVTREGGSNPMWARNGAELFYLDGSTAMTAVPVQTEGETFEAGNPKTLFDARMYTADGTRAYDASPDGSRFILIKDSATADSKMAPAGIFVVLNWLEDLRAGLPNAR